jgi:hypothetical protein
MRLSHEKGICRIIYRTWPVSTHVFLSHMGRTSANLFFSSCSSFLAAAVTISSPAPRHVFESGGS